MKNKPAHVNLSQHGWYTMYARPCMLQHVWYKTYGTICLVQVDTFLQDFLLILKVLRIRANHYFFVIGISQ